MGEPQHQEVKGGARPASDLGRPAPVPGVRLGTPHARVLALQRLAGNQAVRTLMSGAGASVVGTGAPLPDGSSVPDLVEGGRGGAMTARAPTARPSAGLGGPRADGREVAANVPAAALEVSVQREPRAGRANTVLQDVEKFDKRLRGVYDKFPSFAREMRPKLNAARDSVGTACATYDRAYLAFSNVLQSAGDRAKSIDYAQDTAINVALGVIIAVGWEVAAAEAAATGVSAAAGQAAKLSASALAKTGLTNAAQGTVGNLAASNPTGVSVSGAAFPERGGRDTALAGGGARSAARDSLELYQKLLSLTDSVERIDAAGLEFGRLAFGVSDLRAAATRHATAGANDVPDLDRISTALSEMSSALDRMGSPDKAMETVRSRMSAFAASLTSETSVNSDLEVEKRIWIGWIARIPRESVHAVLDLDPIENHLGQLGLIGPGQSTLGVDFGSWTSQSDTEEAQDAAKRVQSRMDNERKWALAHSVVGQVGTIHVYVGATNSASITVGGGESLPARLTSRGAVPRWLEGRPGRIDGLAGKEPEEPPTCLVFDLAEQTGPETEPVP